MLQEHMPLPEGMVFKKHPSQGAKIQPEKRRGRTDWTRVNHALYARPYQWAVIAKNQPGRSIARNINAGSVAAFDREYIIADAVKIQEDPGVWDIYARVRPKPRTTEVPGEPTQREEDLYGLEVARRRRLWFDKHQAEWLIEKSQEQD